MKRFVTPALVLCAALISGCASLPNAMTDQVDKRRVEYALTRNGGHAVIFESGLGGTMDWWAKIFPEISKNTTAFAYNRPGYGKSDPVSTPRDGKHIVDELRSLLRSRGLNPPYILVGHSLGGLYMQLFARRYPNEVSALVLVDSTHPAQLKGAGSPENWPAWLRVAFGVATSAVAKEELNAIDVTGDDVLGLPTFAGNPVIVLSALQPMKNTSALADDANEKRQDIARLYPDAKQIWVDSGHGIPLENPESVISAIREVLPKEQSRVHAAVIMPNKRVERDAPSAGFACCLRRVPQFQREAFHQMEICA
jgi:pimeloyl-ACP methyl ester carboxylesterase